MVSCQNTVWNRFHVIYLQTLISNHFVPNIRAICIHDLKQGHGQYTLHSVICSSRFPELNNSNLRCKETPHWFCFLRIIKTICYVKIAEFRRLRGPRGEHLNWKHQPKNHFIKRGQSLNVGRKKGFQTTKRYGPYDNTILGKMEGFNYLWGFFIFIFFYLGKD